MRRFSRFYTQRLGLLDRELLSSGYTLTESRVLWELAQRSPLSATQLRAELGLDAGYLSRLLRRLREAGVQRHGAIYGQEYGWDARFEALVARIVADFVDQRQPARERAWIARRDGVNLGCIFLVQAAPAEHGDDVAQLRLLLVEPAARGLGLGDRLVSECERFAAAAGYRRMVLWTNSVLHAARALYQRHGWQLENEEPHHSFGDALVGQLWCKPL